MQPTPQQAKLAHAIKMLQNEGWQVIATAEPERTLFIFARHAPIAYEWLPHEQPPQETACQNPTPTK